MDGLTPEQTSLLLSLAQLSGWCADRIGLKIREITNVDLMAEDIWTFNWRWIFNGDKNPAVTVKPQEIEVMQSVLKDYGITLPAGAKLQPLHLTELPVCQLLLVLWEFPSSLSFFPRGIKQCCPRLCFGSAILINVRLRSHLQRNGVQR